jgi:pimeloyl-ACP methyl ester carboxylesterase/acyl-coenzyme A thioesterase PaaI-like protein
MTALTPRGTTARADLEPVPFTALGHHGLELAGDEWGDPAGAPLLLLHGGGQNRHAWRGTAARLAAEGYSITTVDARGHGDSGWSKAQEYEMEHNALDVLALLGRFRQRPAVVGASMGGMSALLAQSMSAEQLFSAVVLVDVTPRMELSGVQRIMGFMTAHPDGFETLEQAAEVIAAYNPHRERSTQVDGLRKVLRERDGRWHWRWDPAFLTSKTDSFDDPALMEARMQQMADELHRAAARLTVPTLLVRGGQSDLVSAESVREFLAAVPHAGYVDVGGAGHMVAGDDNDAFTAAVLDFLRGHVPANAGASDTLDARAQAAAAARRFGHALVHHDGDVEVLTGIARRLEEATAALQQTQVRDRLAELLATERVQALIGGQRPAPAAEGEPISFARHSLVGGPANPFGADATFVRAGEEVVARVTLGAAFEGAPGRAHGGLVSAVIDETMRALLAERGTVAVMTSLRLDHVGSTPVHTPLEFRARLLEHRGRRITVACTGSPGSAGHEPFVEALGTFEQVDLRHFLGEFDRLVEQ